MRAALNSHGSFTAETDSENGSTEGERHRNDPQERRIRNIGENSNVNHRETAN